MPKSLFKLMEFTTENLFSSLHGDAVQVADSIVCNDLFSSSQTNIFNSKKLYKILYRFLYKALIFSKKKILKSR